MDYRRDVADLESVYSQVDNVMIVHGTYYLPCTIHISRRGESKMKIKVRLTSHQVDGQNVTIASGEYVDVHQIIKK